MRASAIIGVQFTIDAYHEYFVFTNVKSLEIAVPQVGFVTNVN